MQAGAWGALLAEPQALKQRMRDAGPSGGASVRDTLPSRLGFVPTLGRTAISRAWPWEEVGGLGEGLKVSGLGRSPVRYVEAGPPGAGPQLGRLQGWARRGGWRSVCNRNGRAGHAGPEGHSRPQGG